MKACLLILFVLIFSCDSFAQKNSKQFNKGLDYLQKHEYQNALDKLYISYLNFNNDTLNISYSKNLIYIGECYFNLNQKDSALAFYERGLKITEEILSQLDYKVLDNIGSSFYRAGKYSDALRNYLEEYSIISKNIGQKSKASIIATSNIASSYYKLNNLEKAKEYYLLTLENKEIIYGKNSNEYSLTLAWLIDLYLNASDYQNAKEKLLTILEIRKYISGIKNINYKNNLFRLASTYEKLLDLKSAEKCYDELIKIEMLPEGDDKIIFSKSLLALVKFSVNAGNFNKAKSLLLKLEELEFLKLNTSLYIEFLNLKVLYNLETFDYIKAYIINQDIIKQYSVDSSKTCMLANHYNINGEIFRRSNLNEDAKYWYKRAMIEIKLCGDTASSSYAAILNNLALLYTNTDTATYYLMLGYNVLNSIKDKVPDHYSNTVLNLAFDAYYYRKDTLLAYSLVEKLLVSYRKYLSVENLQRLFILSSEVTLDLGIDSIAANSLNIYMQLKNRQIGEIASLSSSQLNTLFENNYFEDPRYIGRILMKLIQRDPVSVNKYKLVVRYFNLVNKKKTLLLKIDLTKNNYIKKIEGEGVSTIFYDLIQRRDILIDLEKKNTTDNLFKKELLKTEIDSLENLLLIRSQFYSEIRNTLDIRFESISSALDKNSASVFLFNEGDDYYSFIVRPDYSEPKLIYLFSNEQIKTIIKKQINESDSTYYNKIYNYSNFSRMLIDLIWAPIDKSLSNIKTIYLTSTGTIHLINLPSLPINNKIRLSDKYLFKYISSPGEVISNKKQQLPDSLVQKAWLFGGINYNKMSLSNQTTTSEYDISSNLSQSIRSGEIKWSYLRNTFIESSLIDSLCRSKNIYSKHLSGDFASKTAFKKISAETTPFFIHIATHGYYFEELENRTLDSSENQSFRIDLIKQSENPLVRSGLILSGANITWANPRNIDSTDDDGILTALEVSNLNFSNAKLVVLSACETGLGEIKGSEGVFGLQRAFKIAGVKYLIVSLWKVPDAQTTEFMEHFYSSWLIQKLPIRDAFRQTQITMSKKYSPYQWAAFILVE